MNSKSSALKKRVTNAVGSVLSAPSRVKHGLRASRFGSQAKVLQQARKYDDAANFDASGMPTDAFKVRSVADGIRSKYKGGVK